MCLIFLLNYEIVKKRNCFVKPMKYVYKSSYTSNMRILTKNKEICKIIDPKFQYALSKQIYICLKLRFLVITIKLLACRIDKNL